MMSKRIANPSRKGQAATETMVTIGMILVFVIPILLLLLVGAQARFESLSHVQASSVVRVIADSINEVYVEGPGASKVVVINVPTNTQFLNITENEVVLRLETRSGPTDISTSFFGEVDPAYLGEVKAGGIGGEDAPMGLYPMKFSIDAEGKVVIEHGD
jgi:hypothetical protein